VYDVILADGPVSTWTLRRRFVAKGEGGSRFHRALDDLQERLLIAKAGEEEQWRNGFIWDAFHRWMPEVVGAAGSLSHDAAAARVLTGYLGVVGAATDADIATMFGWSPRLIGQAAATASLERVELLPSSTPRDRGPSGPMRSLGWARKMR
jgi:hypothetical protein